jgi:hypothetical protein
MTFRIETVRALVLKGDQARAKAEDFFISAGIPPCQPQGTQVTEHHLASVL